MEGILTGLKDRTRDLTPTGKGLMGIDSIPVVVNPERDQSVMHNEYSTAAGRGAQQSKTYQAGPSIPCNDSNQSSVISDNARDSANHAAAGDDQNEKSLLDTGALGLPALQAHPDDKRPNTDMRENVNAPEVANEKAGFFALPAHHQSKPPGADGNGRREAARSLDPSIQAGSNPVSRDNPHHFVDTRPQRSVRRLSHIFKGMRRSSTVATSGTAASLRREQSHTSATPAPRHIRRSSTSAASPSGTTPLPESGSHPMVLGPGRMTPYQFPPPVASHLSRRLPPRSATPSMETFPAAATTPSGGAGSSNAALYSQVVALQRQLAARSEEVAHLGRQLEAVGEGGGAGALSERLRRVEREVGMWSERALAAERRVVVFERFLARVRRLRERRMVEMEGRGGEVGEEEGGAEEGIEEEIERGMEALGSTGVKEGGETGQLDGTVEGVWVLAAREVIEYDDERMWMSGY
ncbi:hypothetical protein NKR19_g7175 [Coniochaeta hoffmannii]|uniref:Uncharacterized protein n=1 Tax=Coniochaeta hoffmannii TaxID=91930 RepID=A0AA38VN90_9PEZI|nr:hypothetical protein NKR19_g7175 [Coniochaeta hoffmannii]